MKQMSSNPHTQEDNALYARDQGKHKSPYKQFGNPWEPRDSPKTCFRCGKEGHFNRVCRVKVTCSRCGKSGHIKKFYHVKLRGEDTNTTYEVEESDDIKWEQCFSIEVIDQPANMASIMHPTRVTGSIDYEKEWIVESGCSHHATGDANYFMMFDHMKENESL